MIITCQKCSTSFNLDESLLKQTGSKVRCSKCKDIFVAFPPKPIEEPEKPLEVMPDLEVEETSAEEVGELEFDLEEGLEAEEVPEVDAEAEAETDELELDLDLEEEPETDLAEGEVGELELDLDLEEEPEAGAKAEVEETAEEEIGELDLDLDEEPEAETAPEVDAEAEAETDELELDLELNLDMEEELSVAGSDVESEEELDLSDIEDMLNTDEKELADKKQEVAESGVEAEEELDLSEIENMLDTVEEEAAGKSKAEPEDIDLELDIDEESVELLETEDTDLEFEIEDIEAEDLSQEKAAPEKVTGGEEIDFEETIDTGTLGRESEIEPKVVKKPKPAKKKRISAPFLVLLIVVILFGGAVGGTVALNRTGTDIPFATDFVRRIPFISNLLKPEVQDVGNLKINFVQNTIANNFVENSKAGMLFVVTGKVKNDYSDPRSFIEITCNLYAKGKKLAKKETVFCGNILPDLDLSSMDVAAIKKRLNNRIGDNRSNIKVKPGEMIPFMVVFSNLPVDLEEYDFVVEGSSPG